LIRDIALILLQGIWMDMKSWQRQSVRQSSFARYVSRQGRRISIIKKKVLASGTRQVLVGDLIA